MNGTPLIVIFGAAVLPGGGPSPSLQGRIEYGRAAAFAHPNARVLCSGGVGRWGGSEASVMAEVLVRQGVAVERLILDEVSLDTLQSVVVTLGQVRSQAASQVIVCSDDYHLPRIQLMLRVLGVASWRGPVPRGRGRASQRHWIKMSLREMVAIPYDLVIVLARRRQLRSYSGQTQS